MKEGGWILLKTYLTCVYYSGRGLNTDFGNLTTQTQKNRSKYKQEINLGRKLKTQNVWQMDNNPDIWLEQILLAFIEWNVLLCYTIVLRNSFIAVNTSSQKSSQDDQVPHLFWSLTY